MEKKPVITSLQLVLMSVGSALIFPFTFLPILSSPPANQDVWVVMLTSFVYILLLNLPILFLANKFRGLSINEMSELTLGKVFGKIILIPFVLFCLFCFIACLLITDIFITTYIFPNTPSWVLILFMIVPITYAAYKGAGVISRLSNVFVPIALFAVLLFFILSITDMDFSIFQPVLADSTFLEINQGAFFTAARYSEIIIYWVFSFFLMKKSNLKKTYAVTLLIFLVSMALMVIPTVSVLGVEYAKRTWNPYYTFTRQIELFHSIERIQTLNLMAWFPCALFKLSIYAFMTSYIVANIFKAKTHKPFVIPTSAFAFAICLLPVMNKSSTIEILRSDQVFPYFILPATFGVPLIILIVFLFRKNKINLILSEQPQNKSDS